MWIKHYVTSQWGRLSELVRVACQDGSKMGFFDDHNSIGEYSTQALLGQTHRPHVSSYSNFYIFPQIPPPPVRIPDGL